MKHTVRTLIGIALGIFFLYMTLRGKEIGDILHSISQADLFYSIGSVVLMMVIFALRAARWQLLLSAAGENPSYRNVLAATGIGYFVNSFTPKLGEITRCTSLQSSAGVPIAKSAGVVVSERVYDLLVLFLGLCSILILEMSRLRFMAENMQDRISSLFHGHYVVGAIVLIAISAVVLYRKRKWFAQHPIATKVFTFLREFSKAITDSLLLKKYPLFVLYTIAIWLLLVAVNYMFLKSLSVTNAEGVYFAYVVLFAATMGWALPAPGGIGTSHFFILQLFIVFGMPEDSGIAFGIYSNGLTFAFTIFFGVISVADFYIRRQKNKQMQSIG